MFRLSRKARFIRIRILDLGTTQSLHKTGLMDENIRVSRSQSSICTLGSAKKNGEPLYIGPGAFPQTTDVEAGGIYRISHEMMDDGQKKLFASCSKPRPRHTIGSMTNIATCCSKVDVKTNVLEILLPILYVESSPGNGWLNALRQIGYESKIVSIDPRELEIPPGCEDMEIKHF
ncbi:hypothetical protein ACFE04_000029 [Oxalis oulophora]